MNHVRTMMLSAALAVAGCSDGDDDVDARTDPGTDLGTDAIEFGAAPDAATLIPSAAVEVVTEDDVRFHVVEFGPTTAAYTSAMVETESSLVIVDTGPADEASWAPELRAYADAIGKTTSVIITHAHGDHFGALGSFADLPLYAETRVAPALAANMQFTGLYPNAVNAVSGPTLIGDLSYDFGVVSQAETGENGYISVPAVDALFAGDLVYSDTHLYIREYTPLEAPDELDNWIAGLDSLRTDFGDYDYVFVGHGGYSDDVSAAIDANVEYLTLARDLILGNTALSGGGTATTNQDVVSELAARYPDFIPGGLPFALPGSFFEGDPGASWF